MVDKSVSNLEKVEDGFEGIIKLDVWSGHLNCLGSYGKIMNTPSNGTFQLFVEGDLSEIQLETIKYHVRNQREIRLLILERLLNVYSQWQQQYGYSDEEMVKYMPNVTSLDDFRSLLGPHCIHIMDRDMKGFSYVGYEFGCMWDEEHGFGALTHKNSIVEIGGADIAL